MFTLRLYLQFLLLYKCLCFKYALYGYSHVATLLGGGQCLGDCLDGKCVSRWSGYENNCRYTEMLAPTYRTIDGGECYSNCGEFDESYLWCATASSDSLSWAYCSRFEAKTAKETVKATDTLVCLNECGQHGYSYNWCETSAKWQYCQPEDKIIVFHYLTKDGDLCESPCLKSSGNYYCYNSKHKRVICYLSPSKNSLLKRIDAIVRSNPFGEYYSDGYRVCTTRHKRANLASFGWPLIHSVRDLISEYESEYASFVPIGNTPVQSCTVAHITADSGDFILPLALRARITSAHIRPPHTRESINVRVTNNFRRMNPIIYSRDGNIDERGHLLASVLGGPTEPYNFFPQSMHHNRGAGSRWSHLENEIASYLRADSGRYVEWEAALSYAGEPGTDYRPTAIALSVRRFEANGRRYDDNTILENMYFTNDPELGCDSY